MKKNILNIVTVSFVGGLIGRIARFILNIVIAQGLGFQALGVFATGLVLMKSLAVAAQTGLDDGVRRFIPQYTNSGAEGKELGIIVLGFASPLLFGVFLSLTVSAAFGFFGLYEDRLLHLFIFLCPLYGVMLVSTKITQSYKFARYSVLVRDIAQSGIALTAAVIGVFVFNSLFLVSLGYGLSIVTAVILCAYFIYRIGDFSLRMKPEFELRQVYTTSIPLMFVAISQYFTSWADILMLNHLEGAFITGVYQASYQISIILLLVFQSLNVVFPAVISDLYDEGDIDMLNMLYTTANRWVTYLTGLGGVFLFLYSEPILSIFGDYHPVASVMLFALIVGQFITAATGPVGYLLSMTEYEKLDVINSIAVVILNVILNYLLIRRMGGVGAAIATGTSLALLSLVRLVQVKHLIGVSPYARSYTKNIVPAAFSVFILVSGRILGFNTLLESVIGGGFALAVFLLLSLRWSVGEEDRILLQRL